MNDERTASGTFDVDLTPAGDAGAAVARMILAKSFHGDLEATSVGEMRAIRTVEGSAGYVAMERVVRTLGGRLGSFALQHGGTMDRGSPTLSVTVVPDSGTEGLAGLRGEMTIDASGGAHRYAFRYALPGPGS